MKIFRYLALWVVALPLGACTVAPLYGTQQTYAIGKPAQNSVLSEIYVPSGDTRPAQLVTNELIFLLHGGGNQPANPRYKLEIRARSSVRGAQEVFVGGNLLAGRDLKMTVVYNLEDAATGETVVSGKKAVSASYSSGTQEYANDRAQIDAEKRAAREAAEFVRLDLASALSAPGRQTGRRMTDKDLEAEIPADALGSDLQTVEDVQ